MFDEIREQKRVTSETAGATQLLLLLGKAHGHNLTKKKGWVPPRGAPGHVAIASGLHDEADFETKADPALDKMAARMSKQDGKSHFSLEAYSMDDDDDDDDAGGRRAAMIKASGSSVASGGDEDNDSDDSDDSDESTSEEEDASDSSDDVDEDGRMKPKKPIDVPGMWRLRVPRHTKLLNDCLKLLGQCTSRLELTGSAPEIEVGHYSGLCLGTRCGS